MSSPDPTSLQSRPEMRLLPPGEAPRRIQTSAPGRICLFGEHQDYLRLPVIAMAIDLRVELHAERREDELLRVRMPDVGQELEFNPNLPFEYRHGRDYLPAAANILRRRGIVWPCGYDVEVRGNIPINSGASSSSALQVAWSSFLMAAGGDQRARDAVQMAELAYEGEVREFGAPGGMMDHYTSALGGVVYLDCLDPVAWQQIPIQLGPFVLIDSGTPKATNDVLGRVRGAIEATLAQLGLTIQPDHSPLSELDAQDLRDLRPDARAVLEATLTNRDLTQQALVALRRTPIDCAEIGRMLSLHHGELSGGLGISTPLIDELLGVAVACGAFGGKINGSGGGGSCFALCPEDTAPVLRELFKRGFDAHVVGCGHGLEIEWN